MSASGRRFWRAWGAGFLAAGLLAIVAGLIETWAAELRTPSVADLLYGALLHLLLTFLLTTLLRLIFDLVYFFKIF